MTLWRVTDPGMFTTVQDLGRPGHVAVGVPNSGAADPVSLIVGNRLLGNPDHAAGLECTLRGPTITTARDAWVCLTGARCPNARINGTGGERRMPWCEPTRIRAGESISVGATGQGSRAWLCVSGGLGGPLTLGSRSTFVAAGLGGHEGRALRAGDAIPLKANAPTPCPAPDGLHEWLASVLFKTKVRVIRSLHADSFPPDAFGRLCAGAHVVTPQSDRVGVRLNGPAIPLPSNTGALESEPTVLGGVQIPGNTRPILLGVDRPTTGGYPLLACVIEADLPSIAMLGPNDTLRFEATTRESARQHAIDQRCELDRLLHGHPG